MGHFFETTSTYPNLLFGVFVVDEKVCEGLIPACGTAKQINLPVNPVIEHGTIEHGLIPARGTAKSITLPVNPRVPWPSKPRCRISRWCIHSLRSCSALPLRRTLARS